MTTPGLLLAAAAAAAIVGATFAGAAQAATPPPPPRTGDFVMAAAQSDQFETTEARVAAVEAHDPRVRAYAAEMIRDHAATTQALRRAATASGLAPPPPGMSSDQAMLLGALQSLTGPGFDAVYLRHQVLGHQAALDVETGYADAGSDPAVRGAARSAVPIIQHHLDMAKQLRAQVAGS